MIGSRHGRKRMVVGCVVVATALLHATSAAAQLDQPGQHIRYGAEVEPQLALQLGHLPGDAAGVGPGVRLSVPLIEDGPLKKLNNSLAVGIGFNWAYFQEPCGTYFWDGEPLETNDPDFATYTNDCTAHQFTAPIVVQWNFWVSEVVSVFAEPGVALIHERRSGTGWCDGTPCDQSDNTTKLPFVLWGGARMAMSDSLALTIRLGTPYISAGASLFF
ncbi:MAG: hypothetical protein ACOC1F_05625 [Myxococcota bacterium]